MPRRAGGLAREGNDPESLQDSLISPEGNPSEEEMHRGGQTDRRVQFAKTLLVMGYSISQSILLLVQRFSEEGVSKQSARFIVGMARKSLQRMCGKPMALIIGEACEHYCMLMRDAWKEHNLQTEVLARLDRRLKAVSEKVAELEDNPEQRRSRRGRGATSGVLDRDPLEDLLSAKADIQEDIRQAVSRKSAAAAQMMLCRREIGNMLGSTLSRRPTEKQIAEFSMGLSGSSSSGSGSSGRGKNRAAIDMNPATMDETLSNLDSLLKDIAERVGQQEAELQ